MSYWDSFREIQRVADNMSASQDQIRAYLESRPRIADVMAEMLSARTLLDEIERTQRLMQPPAELLAISAALAAAVRPLPDLSLLARAYEFGGLPETVRRISLGLEAARMLAEVELEEAENISSDVAHQAESQLVEIIPAEALDGLRRVQFAPLVLLDQVLRNPELMHRLGARDFEGFVAALVEQLGFEQVVLTPRSGDEGRDVLAIKNVHGIEILFAFECKRYSPGRPVGPEIARALLGTIMHGNTRAAKGVLVTTSHFTPATRRFILTEPALDGKDFDGVVSWLHEYGRRSPST